MTDKEARKLLLESNCYLSGQGWVIDTPIEEFILLLVHKYLQFKESKEADKNLYDLEGRN